MFNKPRASKKPIVSAVIPVFNEEKTVQGVIRPLLASPLIDEVIVVNDGSRDNSVQVIKRFKPRIVFLNFYRNRGKGFAMAKGVRRAKGEIVTFWDADNLNLRPKHIRSLLQPILRGEAQVVLGYRVWKQDGNAPVQTLTGQRAYFRRDLLPHLREMSRSRFGVEIYLNDALRQLKEVRIPWRDLRTLQKYQKFDSGMAMKEYAKEGVEIAQALTRRQLSRMKRDWERVKKASRVKDLDELRVWVDGIENPQIRRVLHNYLFRYLTSKNKKGRSR